MDIRSFFQPKSGGDAGKASAAGGHVAQKKRTKKLVVESDSESDSGDAPIAPNKASGESSDRENTRNKAAAVAGGAKKEPSCRNEELKPVDPGTLFGGKKVSRSNDVRVTKAKTKLRPKIASDNDEFAEMDDDILMQVDAIDVDAIGDKMEVDEVAPAKTRSSSRTSSATTSPVSRKSTGVVKKEIVAPSIVASSNKAPATRVSESEPPSSRKRKSKPIEIADDDDDDDGDDDEYQANDNDDTEDDADDDFVDDDGEDDFVSTKKSTKKGRAPKTSSSKASASKASSSKTSLGKAKISTKTSSPIASVEEPVTKRIKLEHATSDRISASPSPVKMKTEAEAPASEPVPTEKKKFNPFLHASKGPRAPGSRPVPVGKPDFLKGVTIVLTGELSSLTRDDAKNLIQRYGGRVTGSVSGKTTYLVTGDEPGASKISKAKSLKVDVIDEDQFYAMFDGGDTEEDTQAEQVKEEEKKPTFGTVSSGMSSLATVRTSPLKPSRPPVRKRELETETKISPSKKAKLAALRERASSDAHLWTDKYRPKSEKDYIGNTTMLKRLRELLDNWDPTEGAMFSEVGGRGKAKEEKRYRAVLLSGPPGIGKTSSAHMVANLCGYRVIEFNASDTRSKKSIKEVVEEVVSSHGISEFFKSSKDVAGSRSGSNGGHGISNGLHRGKTVLIMDEVDGMSAGDRGGIAELINIIKKTQIPIICICNDRQNPKIRSLVNHCLDLKFQKPNLQTIVKRMEDICRAENLNLETNAVLGLVQSVNGDIRQVLNSLQTYSLRSNYLSYDEGAKMGATLEKSTARNVFDMISQLLDGHQFRRLNMEQRMELYFLDYELLPLFIQENYLKNDPMLAKESVPNNDIKKVAAKQMDLLAKAAEAISDGDILGNSIRRDGNWSLMTAHCVVSTVLPAFFAHGKPLAGNAFWGAYSFPSWLGKNSTTSKNSRLVRDIHAHMRLSISADKNEVRQAYIPTLAKRLTQPLVELGQDAVPDIIACMDNYYITKDDYDGMQELLLGENYLGKVAGPAKAALTRAYNNSSHPVVFMAESIPKAALKEEKKPKADLEDVVEEDDDVGEDDASDDESEPTVAAGAKGKGKGKAKAGTTKRAATTAGRGRGRGRGKK